MEMLTKNLLGIVFLIAAFAFGTVSVSAQVTVFSTDFNPGAPPELSGITTTEGVQGYSGLGTGSNVFSGDFLRNSTDSSTTLTLTNLPPHGSINIKFLFAIIDSWDGLGAACGTSGPDNFVITIDGVSVLR